MYKSKKGFYKLKNPDKFVPPHDRYMGSFDESTGSVEYKSSLEYKALMFVDQSPKIEKYSVEPFAIQYKKPTTGRIHRYYPDMLLKFTTGHQFLVEIKSSTEITPPKKPKNQTIKSIKNYKRALTTWSVNQAKWDEAKKFCKSKGIKFILLTEKELGICYK